MKKYLITGFITLFPIVLTLMIVKWLFDLLTTPFVDIVEKILISLDFNLQEHHFTIIFISRIIVLIVLFFLLLGLGAIARKFFFDTLLKGVQKLLQRIPVVKTIYSLTKDITKAMLSPDKKTFKQTVLIPFPSDQTYALGLVTGPIPKIFKPLIPQVDLSVFVPTAPHPISGFILLAPKSILTDVDIPSEDVFKFLISCGVIHPGQTTKPAENVS